MESSTISKNQAIYCALGSVFIYAAATPSIKLILQNISPIMLGAFLQLGAGMGLTCFGWLQKWFINKDQTNLWPSRKDWKWLVGPILAGGIGAALSLTTAMSITKASYVSLLINLEIVFTILIARLIFKEHLTARAICGLLAILLGGLCLSWTQDLFVSWQSISLMGICCLCWAIETNTMGQMKNSEAIQIARCRGLVAGTFNFCLALLLGYHLPNVGVIMFALTIGIMAQGLALTLYITALQRLGVARATAYFATEPFVGALLSVLVLREAFTVNLAIAALLMALGVWLHLSEKHEHEYIHTPID